MMSVSSADEVCVAVTLAVPIGEAFGFFTEEIDLWWRQGVRFRSAGPRRGMIKLEPLTNGRLFESIDSDQGELVIEAGHVTLWSRHAAWYCSDAPATSHSKRKPTSRCSLRGAEIRPW